MAEPKDVEIPQTKIYDKVFNAEDADLALVCTCVQPTGTAAEASDQIMQVQQQHISKVHRKVLAAPSTFFEDMMLHQAITIALNAWKTCLSFERRRASP